MSELTDQQAEEYLHRNAIVNPRYCVEKQIVTGVSDPENQIQQVGIDLRIDRLWQISGQATIAKDSRILPGYREILPKKLLSERKNDTPIVMEQAWIIEPGYYMWDAVEHVKLPENLMALIVHRSTLMKSGVKIVSAIWDPGFEGSLGCSLDVRYPIKIERGARVAQVYFLTAEAASQYTGVYLNKSVEDFSQLQA